MFNELSFVNICKSSSVIHTLLGGLEGALFSYSLELSELSSVMDFFCMLYTKMQTSNTTL